MGDEGDEMTCKINGNGWQVGVMVSLLAAVCGIITLV